MIYKQVITDVMVNMSISLVVTGKNTENIIKCSPETHDERLFIRALCNLGDISQLEHHPAAFKKLSLDVVAVSVRC